MKRFVLGVDGGGTSTRATIMSEWGEIVGAGVSGPSNYDDVGVEKAQENIAAAVAAARRQAEMPVRPFAAAFLGMAGVASPTDRRIIHQIAQNLRLAPPDFVGVDHDIRIALEGGLLGRSGIVLIAGTGSSCYGRNAEGDEWRSGGWGPLVSDEGSAYWFGVQAMKAAVRAHDGRWQTSSLLPAVMGRLELQHIDDLLRYLYVRGMSRLEIAALGPLIFDAATEGDEVALDLIRLGARQMAACVVAVAQRIGLVRQPGELALTGGVFQAGDIVMEPLYAAVNEQLPQCEIFLAKLSPSLGACLLALKRIGIVLDSNVLSLLQNSPEW